MTAPQEVTKVFSMNKITKFISPSQRKTHNPHTTKNQNCDPITVMKFTCYNVLDAGILPFQFDPRHKKFDPHVIEIFRNILHYIFQAWVSTLAILFLASMHNTSGSLPSIGLCITTFTKPELTIPSLPVGMIWPVPIRVIGTTGTLVFAAMLKAPFCTSPRERLKCTIS